MTGPVVGAACSAACLVAVLGAGAMMTAIAPPMTMMMADPTGTVPAAVAGVMTMMTTSLCRPTLAQVAA